MPTKVTNITQGDASNEVITKITYIKKFVQKISLTQDYVLNVYKDKIVREEHEHKFF